MLDRDCKRIRASTSTFRTTEHVEGAENRPGPRHDGTVRDERIRAKAEVPNEINGQLDALASRPDSTLSGGTAQLGYSSQVSGPGSRIGITNVKVLHRRDIIRK